jgi:hypothetical protein
MQLSNKLKNSYTIARSDTNRPGVFLQNKFDNGGQYRKPGKWKGSYSRV